MILCKICTFQREGRRVWWKERQRGAGHLEGYCPGDWPGKEWPPLGPFTPASLIPVLNILSQGRHLNFTWSPYYPTVCSAWLWAWSLDSWGCWTVNHKLRRQIHILSQFKPNVQNQGAGRLIPSGDWENLQACFQLLVVANSPWPFSTSRYSFSLH